MIVVDDFLSDFNGFRAYCDNLDFDGVESPYDGVFYPGVSLDIPREIQEEVIENLSGIVGEVFIKAMFLRLTLPSFICPHQAHTDSIMGDGSLMLYLNREEHCQGGTSFVVHKKSGMYSNPKDEDELEAWKDDTNTPEKWHVLDICEMKPNRACLFDASLMHRAEPVGGFGNDSTDGRLVLTCFYDFSS